jgi:hypothetical protein
MAKLKKIPVDFGVLMLNHPNFVDIVGKVTEFPIEWETCCIQMSYAMNKSGARIERRGKNVGFIEKK